MALNAQVVEVNSLNTATVALDELRLATATLNELRLSVLEVVAVAEAVVFSSGEVGDVSTAVVEITFDGTVVSPSDDYKLGVTIKVNAVSITISSAVRQTNTAKVRYTLASAVDANDTVTFEYASGPGDLQTSSGSDIADIAATGVTNNVGTHWYFDTADDSAHI